MRADDMRGAMNPVASGSLSALGAVLGDHVLAPDGKRIETASLHGQLLVFFSGAWRDACRTYAAMLIEVHDAQPRYQVVFGKICSVRSTRIPCTCPHALLVLPQQKHRTALQSLATEMPRRLRRQ